MNDVISYFAWLYSDFPNRWDILFIAGAMLSMGGLAGIIHTRREA